MHWVILVSVIVTPVGSHPAHTFPAPALREDARGCRLVVPADLGTGAVRWIGSCVRGLASGAGVLRVDRSVGGVTLFAGTMREGRPVAGYLDTGSADTAGPSLRFDGADGLPTANQAEARRACAIAAAGAKAAANHLRSAGNMASARFYDGWSGTVRRCTYQAE